ncbi:uncharacterized protein LOC142609041 [Castanea sativa]|uniref:uncharacterized protein LOC142609041 n=1 Tax=Castanea sativa TaxID=21020 RepID=UPI003F6544D6
MPKDESLTHTPLSVSHLFDASNHCWNARLIHQLFDEVFAQAILSIPLPYHPKQDKLIWILDSKGRFSVKSTYRVSIAQEPQSDHSDVPWMKLWKARIPERIKMLLWRIGTNSIPTKENLSCRLEHIDPVCTLCKSVSESCVHLFFGWHISRALWYTACWGFRLDQNMVQTFEDIIKLVLEPPVSTLPSYDKWLITLNMAFTVEEIWHLRNNILFQDAHIDISKSSKSVMSRFSNTATALGVIARNHKGEVTGIWGRCRSLCPPLQAEAATLLWAIEIAKREHWHHVVFEGDAKACFEHLSQSDSTPDWLISTFINNILGLALCFSSVKFSWVRRVGNSAAHEVARFALSSIQSFIFHNGNIPPVIEFVCKADYPACISFS